MGGQKPKLGLIGPRRGDGLHALTMAGAAMGREETRALSGGGSALGGRRGRMVREIELVERESLGIVSQIGGRGVSRAVGGGLSKVKGALQVQREGRG